MNYWQDLTLPTQTRYVFPIATALLPNKRAITYRIFFQMLHEAFPQLSPQGISCDYELAIQNAARGEWEDVSIDGCYWHLCSNLYKHLEQEGLSARYDSDVQFAHECRKIVALACVPVSHLDVCFASLKQNLPLSLNPILDWFENYYLGPLQPDGIRRTARFPIDSWNLVQRITRGENRTNNYAEAHHRKVACELGVCHPNLWRFIDSMKLVQRGVDEAYSEMVLGHEPPRKKKKYRVADDRMLALVKQAVEAWKEIVPMDYLSDLRQLEHFAQVVRMKKERLLYYDSLHGDGSSCLILIKEYLQLKASMKQNSTMDPINWLGQNDKSVPRQKNGWDCGVFVCQFAESASREIRPSFKQEDMEHIRKEMFREIEVGKLSRK